MVQLPLEDLPPWSPLCFQLSSQSAVHTSLVFRTMRGDTPKEDEKQTSWTQTNRRVRHHHEQKRLSGKRTVDVLDQTNKLYPLLMYFEVCTTCTTCGCMHCTVFKNICSVSADGVVVAPFCYSSRGWSLFSYEHVDSGNTSYFVLFWLRVIVLGSHTSALLTLGTLWYYTNE